MSERQSANHCHRKDIDGKGLGCNLNADRKLLEPTMRNGHWKDRKNVSESQVNVRRALLGLDKAHTKVQKKASRARRTADFFATSGLLSPKWKRKCPIIIYCHLVKIQSAIPLFQFSAYRFQSSSNHFQFPTAIFHCTASATQWHSLTLKQPKALQERKLPNFYHAYAQTGFVFLGGFIITEWYYRLLN